MATTDVLVGEAGVVAVVDELLERLDSAVMFDPCYPVDMIAALNRRHARELKLSQAVCDCYHEDTVENREALLSAAWDGAVESVRFLLEIGNLKSKTERE